jgi:hypothetical protein
VLLYHQDGLLSFPDELLLSFPDELLWLFPDGLWARHLPLLLTRLEVLLVLRLSAVRQESSAIRERIGWEPSP